MKVSELGETGLIIRLAQRISTPQQVIKGIGDDTAVLRGPGEYDTLFTTDMLVEDVHFSRHFASPYQVGVKAIAVNASDIAAMGGRPTYSVISIALPPETEVKDVEELYRGIEEAAGRYGITVVGGDTVKADRMVINVALLGEVKKGKAVYRHGAKPGDLVFVTGTPGKSAAGLFICLHPELEFTGPAAEFAQRAHLEPVARVGAGMLLGAKAKLSSMNDISDGLATEIHEICRASNTGCRLDVAAVPVDTRVREIARAAGVDALNWALYGGEDFELVFTAPPEQKNNIRELMKSIDLPVVVVGQIVDSREGIYAVWPSGEKKVLEPKGYDHFK